MMRLHIFVIGILVWFWTSPAHAQKRPEGEQVIRDILAKWEERRNAVKSIGFKTSGTVLYPKGCFTATEHPATKSKQKGSPAVRPPEDYRAPIAMDMLIDLVTGKIRLELDQMEWFDLRDGGRFARKFRKTTFNGKDVKAYEPRKENTTAEYQPGKGQYELWIQPKDSPMLYDTTNEPLFHAIGFVRTLRGSADISTLRSRFQPSDFTYRGLAKLNSHNCHVIECQSSTTSVTYWIDLDQDGAIAQSTAADNGILLFKTQTSFRQVEGHWLPEKWTRDWYTVLADGKSTRLFRSENREVTEVRLNPSITDDLFDVELTPNMVVWKSEDMTAPGKGEYYVGRDSESLVPLGLPDPSSRFPLWLKISLGGLLLLGLWTVVRYRQRRA